MKELAGGQVTGKLTGSQETRRHSAKQPGRRRLVHPAACPADVIAILVFI
jgi:hypothetical protein